MGTLEHKVALVTGGGSGIGAAIAQALASEGAAVAVIDMDGARARDMAEQLQAQGATVFWQRCDVTQQQQVNAAFDASIAALGGIDILVASAGIGVQRAFLDTPLDEWQRVLSVNLTGAFLCGQAAARAMLARGGGRILNIASGAGLRGVPGRSAYGASKGGLILLTKVMAAELGVHGITVNAIAPGPIETAMTLAMHTAETRNAYIAATPLHRYGALQEVAASAVFMASEGAGYITGHTLEVDGGMAASGPLFKV